MEIDFTKLDKFHKWFMITMITDLTHKSEDHGNAFFDEAKAKGDAHQVTFSYNGYDLDPLAAIDRLKEEFDRMVKEKASELLKQALDEKIAPIQQALDAVERDIYEKFGLTRAEDYTEF